MLFCIMACNRESGEETIKNIMKTKFIILLPVYNAEDTIGRAIVSVLNQTYKNFELIIINDGSTDSTLEVCTKYAEGNDKVEVITRENSGIASARNFGIELAERKGPDIKIVWIDADDELVYDILENLDDKFISSSELDAIFYDYDVVMSDGKRINNGYICQRYDENKIIRGKEALRKILIGDINNYMWAFAADIHCYQGVFFPEGKKYEDLATLYKIVDNTNTVLVMKRKGYRYYFDNPYSLSKNFTCQDAYGLLDIISEVGQNLNDNDLQDYTVIFEAIYLCNIVISLSAKDDKESKKIIKLVYKRFKEIRHKLKYQIYRKSRYAKKIGMMKWRLIEPIYRLKRIIENEKNGNYCAK